MEEVRVHVWNLEIRHNRSTISNDFSPTYGCLAWFHYPLPFSTFQRRVFSPWNVGYVGNSGDSQGLKGLRVIPRFPPIDRFELWNYFSRFSRTDHPDIAPADWQVCFCSRMDEKFYFFRGWSDNNSISNEDTLLTCLWLKVIFFFGEIVQVIGVHEFSNKESLLLRRDSRTFSDAELTLLSINLGRESGKLCRCVEAGPGQTQRCRLIVVGESTGDSRSEWAGE